MYQILTLFVVTFLTNQNVMPEQKKNEDTAQQNNLIIIIKEIQALYKLLKAKSAFVKRWHHTNSTAIVSYISNTFSNLRSARNQPTGVKSAHRQ